MQTSNFHSDIFKRLKSIKSKQVTFTHKKHELEIFANKMQASNFHSDIFKCLKSIKSKQATFTQKKDKMQTSNFHSDIFIRLKRGKKIDSFLFLRCF